VIDTRKLTRWYDFQAPVYRLWRNRYDSPLVSHLVSLVRSLPARSAILDAGCGTGLFSIALARALPDSRVEGVDISAGMLRVASREANNRALTNVRFSRGDVTAMAFADDTFDVVVAAGLFPNLNGAAPGLGEMRRVLAPDGTLFVVEFDREAMGAAARLFFRVMILGYKTVSFVFRRFRFADAWDVRASTIDRREFEQAVGEAELRIVSVVERDDHLLFQLTKGRNRCHDS
jgi:ubiquinone/menaquinone biosynthesis C-methylase UbiE